MHDQLTGIGGSAGRATGPLVRMGTRLELPAPVPVTGPGDRGHATSHAPEDLAPADTSSIDPSIVLGLVTERGGPTSHTAILARALGIPAIVCCRGVLAVPDGTLVLLDGGSGDL